MLDKPQRTYCQNPNCPKHTVYSGGHFKMIGKDWYCLDCAPNATVFNEARNLWDFTTTHFNGQTVHVKNGAHLDSLCKKFGVSNHARENMERNWNTTPAQKPLSAPSFGERRSF